jgi:hypothetical protein
LPVLLDFYSLEIGLETSFSNPGNITADAAFFFSLTAPFNAAAGYCAFIANVTYFWHLSYSLNEAMVYKTIVLINHMAEFNLAEALA